VSEAARKSKPYFPGVQCLRGVASLLVVFYHCGLLLAKKKYFSFEILGGATGFGYRGVDMFFVISGFVMGLYVFDSSRNKSGARFAEARARRIFIPYLPVFLVMTAAASAMPSLFPEAYRSADYSVIRNLLIFPRANLDTFVPVVAWSLAHELFFYLMVGVLLYVPFGKHVFALWLTLSGVAFFSGVALDYPWSFLFSRYNLAFGLGLLSFYAVQRWRGEYRAAAIAVGLAGLALAMALEARAGMGKPGLAIDASYFVSFAIVITAFAKSNLRLLEVVGKISYSLYLVHYPLLVVCVIVYLKLFGSALPVVAFGFAIGVSLVAGFVYYWLIEARAMSLRFGKSTAS